ncbi:MAG: enoyl-CoA hydratase-related protein [Pseudomonadota bacterium]
MSEPLILEESSGAIAAITLNDPRRLNILSSAMMTALALAIETYGDDTATRVILLKANGKAFCAGHDLGELNVDGAPTPKKRAQFDQLFSQCTSLMQLIGQISQPVITLVHGVATAAGCQLVASSDIALASTDAKFGLNGIDIGLFCSTPMVAASRAMQPKTCFEMLVSGRFLSAQEAQQSGLVTRVVAPGALFDEGEALAARIADKQASAIALGKKAFYAQLEASIDDAYRTGKAAIVKNLLLAQTQDRISAFRNKRHKP